MALNDVQYTFLRGEGYEGALPDMWQSWLFDQAGTPSNTDENNDLWIILLTDLGYTGALQDMWKAWLADNGFADDNDYWQAVIDGIVPSPGGDTEGLKVGTSAEGTGILFGFGNGQGALEPTAFLDTGTNITKFGVIEGAGDWADNGDWSNNGDWAIATFDKLILGEVLPDVGDIEITINGITTTATFNNGVYESEDANAELIYDLLKMNVGTTYSFDIVEVVPQGNLIVSDFSSLTGDPSSSAYALPSQTGGAAIGSLNPPILLNGSPLAILYALNVDLGDGNKKYVLMGNDAGDLEGRVDTVFNGVPYTFDALPGLGTTPTIQSDNLYDFLFDNRDTPIVFTAEAIAPDLFVGFSSDPDVKGYNDGTVSTPFLPTPEAYGSTTITAMPNGEAIGGIDFAKSGFNRRIIISGPSNAPLTNVGTLYANLNGESWPITNTFAGNYFGKYLSQSRTEIADYIDDLSENQGISFSITETPLFSLVI